MRGPWLIGLVVGAITIVPAYILVRWTISDFEPKQAIAAMTAVLFALWISNLVEKAVE